MGIVTIGRFLIGQRQAILDIAASRNALWVGLLFVFSAGFAREYDGEDLLHEPWHLMIPMAASLATSTLLFAIMWLALHGWKTFPNEWRTYQSFVALYWMTAPLAWIYAIPVERFLPAGEATAANFWFLGIVAVWRVVLMMRVVSVLFQAPIIRVLFPFMLFADGVLLALIDIMPVPVLAVMGGVRLSESAKMIQTVSLFSMVLGMLTLPIWGLGSLIALFTPRTLERIPSFQQQVDNPVHGSVWVLTAASLLIWSIILPFTQPEQQRRWKAERRMYSGEIAGAMEFIAQHQQRDFPPHWDPPPRIGEYRGLRGQQFAEQAKRAPLIDVMEELDRHPDLPTWVWDAYARKIEDHFESEYVAAWFWDRLSPTDFDRYLAWLERHPPSEELRGSQAYAIQDGNEKRTSEQKERFRRIMKLDLPEAATEIPSPPMPAEAPQTPPAAESKDGESGAVPPADKAADR